jgi:hypothetical protein
MTAQAMRLDPDMLRHAIQGEFAEVARHSPVVPMPSARWASPSGRGRQRMRQSGRQRLLS